MPKFTILLPDGSDILRDVNSNLPRGMPIEREAHPDGYVPYDPTVPEGQRQIGWKLDSGKCVPDTVAIPEPTAEQAEALAEFEAKIAEQVVDKDAAAQLHKISAVIEDKSASPEVFAEALRLMWRDYVRRNNIKPAR